VKGEEKRGLRRSDEQAEPCVSTSVSNGLALCIDIILAASYLLSFLLPAISLTSYSSPCIVPLPATVPVTLRAMLTMSQTSPSYSPRPTHYRPRRVFLALIVATSYLLSSSPPASSLTSYASLCILQLPGVSVALRAALTMSQSSSSYLPRPTRYRPLHVLLALIVATSYSLSSSPPVSSLTSYSSLCILQLPGVAVTLRAALTMSQSSPSYSPHPTHYRPRHVLLALIVATSYSLSSSPPASSLSSSS